MLNSHFADELGAPFVVADFISVGFAINHYFDLLDGTVRIQADRISDEVMFAHNFVDDKPIAPGHAPDLLFVL